MTYLKKSYAYTPEGKQVCFAGHISRETAVKRGFKSVTLAILDLSGKGRGENRHYYAPEFAGMKKFN